MALSETTGTKIIPAQVQTTDATVTTCGYFTLPDECAAFVRAYVIGIQSGSTNAAAYHLQAGAKGQSGTRSLITGGPHKITESGTNMEDVGTWDCTIDVSGNDVRVRVTGLAATTIDWQTTMEITLFKP